MEVHADAPAGNRLGFCHEGFVTGPEGPTVAKVIPQIARTGYSAVEIGMPFIRPLLPPGEIPASERELIRQVAKDSGVALYTHWVGSMDRDGILPARLGFYPHIAGVELDMSGKPVSSEPDVYNPTIQGKTIGLMRDHFGFAGDIGALAVTYGSPMTRNKPPGYGRTDEGKDYDNRCFDFWCAMGRLADEFQIPFGLEPLVATWRGGETNHVVNSTAAIWIADRVRQETGSTYFGVTNDRKAMEGELPPSPKRILDACREYTVHIHLNDPTDRVWGPCDQPGLKMRMAPGYGNTGFVDVFQAAKENGYGGAFSVETFGNYPSAMEIAQTAFGKLTGDAAEAGLELITLR